MKVEIDFDETARIATVTTTVGDGTPRTMILKGAVLDFRCAKRRDRDAEQADGKWMCFKPGRHTFALRGERLG